MKIGKSKFDELGEKLRDWLEEQGFETNVSQDLELENLILSCLGVDYDPELELDAPSVNLDGLNRAEEEFMKGCSKTFYFKEHPEQQMICGTDYLCDECRKDTGELG